RETGRRLRDGSAAESGSRPKPPAPFPPAHTGSASAARRRRARPIAAGRASSEGEVHDQTQQIDAVAEPEVGLYVGQGTRRIAAEIDMVVLQLEGGIGREIPARTERERLLVDRSRDHVERAVEAGDQPGEKRW